MATYTINTAGNTPAQNALVATAAQSAAPGNSVNIVSSGGGGGGGVPYYDTPIGVGGQINTATGQVTSGSLAGTQAPISSANLQQNQSYLLPTSPTASNVGTDAMTSVGAQNSVYQNALSAAAAAQDKATNSTSGTDSLHSALSLLGAIPQKEDVLSSPEVSQAHNAEVAAQNEVTHQTSLLNAITTKQQQDLLTTRGTASANGVTEAVYGGQANEINREAAIQALPVAAAVAVAQGNLKLAQDNLQYMTQVVTEKVNNAFDYKTAVYNSVNDFVNKSEATVLDALKTKAANDHADQVNNLNFAQSLVSNAIAQGPVNSSVVSSMLKLMQNPASPTFSKDIGVLAGQIQQNPLDIRLKQAQIANAYSGRQDSLEQQYRTALEKAFSARSGSLGVQSQKVDQAIHLRTLLDQYKDPQGNYNVPPAQYAELAQGMASLLSGNNSLSDSRVADIQQKSSAGDLGKLMTYVTGTNYSGSTNSILKNLSDSIDRQGGVAQQLRDQYMGGLRGLQPSGLDPTRAAAISQEYLPSYADAVAGKYGASGTQSSLPQNIQSTLQSNLSFSSDGKTAYLPRAIWSTLGAQQDSILAEAKTDGFNLLIK